MRLRFDIIFGFEESGYLGIKLLDFSFAECSQITVIDINLWVVDLWLVVEW